MRSPVFVIPKSFESLLAMNAAAAQGGVPPTIVHLVEVRASQINGCSVCVEIHSHQLRDLGEGDERLFAVAAWRDTPYFSDAERAALALAEAVTRLSDREDPVPDAIWNEAKRHFDEKALASLLLVIAQINVWNRLNVATRQPGDGWKLAVAGARDRAAGKAASQ
jgi:AhpD family alkylhydroperoxidase